MVHVHEKARMAEEKRQREVQKMQEEVCFNFEEELYF